MKGVLIVVGNSKKMLGIGSPVMFKGKVCEIIRIQRKGDKIFLTLEHVNNYAEVNTYNCFSDKIKPV